MAAGNTNFTTLISTTLQNFANKLEDSVITNNALFFMLKKAGNVKVVSGGRQFVRQLLFQVNSSFAARTSLQTIDLPVTDSVTATTWDIKIVDGSVVLPIFDVAQNSGDKEKLLDYINAKKTEAEVSMGEILGDEVFGTAAASQNFDGLQKLIHEDPTSQTDVGGINPQTSGNEYWRNYSHDTAVTAFNTSLAGFNAIDTSINQSTFGRMGPKLIVTTKLVWTLFQLGLTSNMRYSRVDLPIGKAGFKALEYATIPVVFDDNCPTNNLYGIDTEGISLNILSQGNFKQTPFVPARNQLAESSLLYFFGNLTMGSRRTNFVIDEISG